MEQVRDSNNLVTESKERKYLHIYSLLPNTLYPTEYEETPSGAVRFSNRGAKFPYHDAVYLIFQ